MGMIDREKVIKGLGCCATNRLHREDCEAMDCVYLGLEGHGCIHQLIRDALALLKARGPRVMTLEEVEASELSYIEIKDFSGQVKGVYPCLYTGKHKGLVEGDYSLGFVSTVPYLNNCLGKSYYGKVWRCWTSRPTDAQREAVKWE